MNPINRLRRNAWIAAIAMPMVVIGTAGTIFAAETEGADGAKEKAAIAAAKVSLPQAIATAEKEVGGKSTANGIENQDDTAIYYDITVNKTGVDQKVLIDMQIGKVVSVAVEDKVTESDKKD